MGVCMCGICNVWGVLILYCVGVCVCIGFVMCGFMCLYGSYHLCVSLYMSFVICGFVCGYMWLL